MLRRESIQVGGLTALGLTLGNYFAARSAVAASPTADAPGIAAESCILIWLDGGPSHLETFDPKPDAPAEVRGPLGSIATKIAGVRIAESLSETAAIMDKVTIIRSMTSTLGEHNFASHAMLTGYDPTSVLTYPGISAVASHLLDPISALPSSVSIGRPNAMAGVGYLDGAAPSFVIDDDPSRPDFRVKDLTPSIGITPNRMDRRRQYQAQIDRLSRSLDQSSDAGNTAIDQAYRLIGSSAAIDAFDLNKESVDVRNRYGRHELGQSCLMARRLIEAGTRFVTVTDRGWDTHEDLVLRLREGYTGGHAGKLPKFDRAYSALISDLDQRGLLESTLVIVMGEFGRTPKLNPRGGRDHWPRAFSVAISGGGAARGKVIGRTDSRGELPADLPVSPADLVRTLYQGLGIDPNQHLQTADGRPIQINRDGKIVPELFG